jgi:hypothetical protein
MTTPNALTFFPVTGDYQCTNDPLPPSTGSTPTLAPVQAIVTFTARVPQGFTAFVPDYQISGDTNAQQTVTLIGAITGGLWGLNFNGVWMSPYIAPGSTAAALQTALQAMSTIGSGNCLVTGASGGPYTVEFTGALANAPQSLLLSDASQLTVSSGTPAVAVDPVATGSSSRVGPTAIAFPPRTGRIWTTGQLCSINHSDSPNVELIANSVPLGLAFDLIYDVTFSKVQFGNLSGTLAPFAFLASTDTTPFSLTDPNSSLLPYQPPIQQAWSPGWLPGAHGATVVSLRQARQQVVGDWRQRRGIG